MASDGALGRGGATEEPGACEFPRPESGVGSRYGLGVASEALESGATDGMVSREVVDCQGGSVG